MGNPTRLFRRPEQAEMLFRRALALDTVEQHEALAERLYRETVRIEPEHWEAWNNLGRLAFRRGDPGQARAWWERALEVRPDAAETESNIGAMLQHEGKLEAAVTHLLRAVRLDPLLAEARFNLAHTLQQRGQYRAALRHWEIFLRRHYDSEDVEAARELETECWRRLRAEALSRTG